MRRRVAGESARNARVSASVGTRPTRSSVTRRRNSRVVGRRRRVDRCRAPRVQQQRVQRPGRLGLLRVRAGRRGCRGRRRRRAAAVAVLASTGRPQRNQAVAPASPEKAVRLSSMPRDLAFPTGHGVETMTLNPTAALCRPVVRVPSSHTAIRYAGAQGARMRSRTTAPHPRRRAWCRLPTCGSLPAPAATATRPGRARFIRRSGRRRRCCPTTASSCPPSRSTTPSIACRTARPGRALGEGGAGALPLRAQGVAADHARKEAAGLRGRGRALRGRRRCAGRPARAGVVPVAAHSCARISRGSKPSWSS